MKKILIFLFIVTSSTLFSQQTYEVNFNMQDNQGANIEYGFYIYIFKNDVFQQYSVTVNGNTKFSLPNGNYVYKTDIGASASFSVNGGNVNIPVIHLNKVSFQVKDSSGIAIGKQNLGISSENCYNSYYKWSDANGESLFYLFDGNYNLGLHNQPCLNNIFVSQDTTISIILPRVNFLFKDPSGNGSSGIIVYFYSPIASQLRSDDNGIVSFGLLPGEYSYWILLGDNIGGTITVNKRDTTIIFDQRINNVFVSIVDAKGTPAMTNTDLALTDSTGYWLDHYYPPRDSVIYKFHTSNGKYWMVYNTVTIFEIFNTDLYFIFKESLPLLYGTREQILPTILTHPASQEAMIFSQVNFAIQVTNSNYLKYEWQKDGVTIANANDSIYSFMASSPDFEGNYRCIASNAFGADTSNIATLSVNTDTRTTSTELEDITFLIQGNMVNIASVEKILKTEVWTVDGRHICSPKFNTFQLAKGVYIIYVQTESEIRKQKIVIY